MATQELHVSRPKVLDVLELDMAERVGFYPLIAEACTALHNLVQNAETKDLVEFRFPLDFIEGP